MEQVVAGKLWRRPFGGSELADGSADFTTTIISIFCFASNRALQTDGGGMGSSELIYWIVGLNAAFRCTKEEFQILFYVRLELRAVD